MQRPPRPIGDVPPNATVRKYLGYAGIAAIIALVVAVIIGACGIFIYSLSSPEAYVAVERWKAIIGYGSIPVIAVLIGGVLLIDKMRSAHRRRQRERAQKAPQR